MRKTMAIALLLVCVAVFSVADPSFRGLQWGKTIEYAAPFVASSEEFNFDLLRNGVIFTDSKPIQLGSVRLNVMYTFDQTNSFAAGSYFVNSTSSEEATAAFIALLNWATSMYGPPDRRSQTISFPGNPKDNSSWSQAVISNISDSMRYAWSVPVVELWMIHVRRGLVQVALTYSRPH